MVKSYMPRRIAFYTFYDPNGQVKDYVLYYLSALKTIAQKVIVIVNGSLSDSGRDKLQNLGAELLIRENRGLDFGAWKAAVKHIGFENLAAFSELILTNCSCYGPLYHFNTLFQKMDKKTNIDFWGITLFPTTKNALPPWPAPILQKHVQSYFLVLRSPILESNAFQQWWENLTEYDTYYEEVFYHEIAFTQYLALQGYQYDVVISVPTDKIMTFEGMLQSLQQKSPFIKRKALTETNCWLRALLYRYLRCHTNYDLKLIEEEVSAISPIKQSKCYELLAILRLHFVYIRYFLLFRIFRSEHYRQKYNRIKTIKDILLSVKKRT